MTLPTRWLVPSGYSTTNDPDVFPTLAGQNFIVNKSPKYPPTIVKTAASGREVRVQLASQPTWDFKLSYEFLTNNPPTVSDLQTLQAFFLTRYGQALPFFFYDPYDNAVANQQFATGDGATTTFQLLRTINAGANNAFVENVYALLGTPTVKVAGVAKTYGTDYTIGSYGSITFASAAAASAALTWSGQFLFLCRFAQDNLDAEQFALNLWSAKGVAFQSWHP